MLHSLFYEIGYYHIEFLQFNERCYSSILLLICKLLRKCPHISHVSNLVGYWLIYKFGELRFLLPYNFGKNIMFICKTLLLCRDSTSSWFLKNLVSMVYNWSWRLLSCTENSSSMGRKWSNFQDGDGPANERVCSIPLTYLSCNPLSTKREVIVE